MFLTGVYSCVSPPCVPVAMLMPTCVYAGVRAYPPVCVCTFLGSAREPTSGELKGAELTGAEQTATVAEETDIDAEDASHASAAEELNLNRGVTDLDDRAKAPDPTQPESKVKHLFNVLELSLFYYFPLPDRILSRHPRGTNMAEQREQLMSRKRCALRKYEQFVRVVK